MIRTVSALFLVACHGPASGTFVGNPTMTARLAGNPVQRVDGGVLDALELHFVGTNDALTALGPTLFRFDGPDATEHIDVPTGDHDGLFLVVDQFEVRFDEDGALTTIVADDFDLYIPASFATREHNAYVLRFGDDAWLAELASLSDPGEVWLETADPALKAAFFDGLIAGSTVLDARTE